jgi:alpha-glucosidase
MAADLIENYEGNPAFQFIEDVPVDWETTRVIDAQIGDYLITARKDKQSDDWYLGAITDELGREFTIGLDFLETGRTYTAQIYKDAKDADYKTNPEAYIIEEKQVKQGDSLAVKLAPGGGMAVRFKAIN